MRKVSLGIQSFEALRESKSFYVDKTSFIREWYEEYDEATLITRPRRFGKTLAMSMLNCFFSSAYQNRQDLFEGLEISRDSKMMSLQGSFPVIHLSFLAIDAQTFTEFLLKMHNVIARHCVQHEYLLDGNILSDSEKALFSKIREIIDDCPDPDDEPKEYDTFVNLLKESVQTLSIWLYKYHHKKVLILIDEYDKPVQSAYMYGYYDKAIQIVRGFFTSSVKANEYLGRALFTGVTKIAKESLFSDMNHLTECTVLDDLYADYFGFTEKEMADILREYGIEHREKEIREWYDGYNVGHTTGIYNPWSVLQVIKNPEQKLRDFWNDTGGISLLDNLVRYAHPNFHETLQGMLQGEYVETYISRNLVFPELRERSTFAIWSLLLHAGYIKPVPANVKHVLPFDAVAENAELVPISLVNTETALCMLTIVRRWYMTDTESNQMNLFVNALLSGDLGMINQTLSRVVSICVSSFDSGVRPSGKTNRPENFFHGLTTGMVVSLLGRYSIVSNGEAGSGRFDLSLIPKDRARDPYAYIIEFKVFSAKEGDKTLEDTAKRARQQIIDQDYSAALRNQGFEDDEIRKYGFGFRGKKVLVV